MRFLARLPAVGVRGIGATSRFRSHDVCVNHRTRTIPSVNRQIGGRKVEFETEPRLKSFPKVGHPTVFSHSYQPQLKSRFKAAKGQVRDYHSLDFFIAPHMSGWDTLLLCSPMIVLLVVMFLTGFMSDRAVPKKVKTEVKTEKEQD